MNRQLLSSVPICCTNNGGLVIDVLTQVVFNRGERLSDDNMCKNEETPMTGVWHGPAL
jgi:hypothetical protein